MTADFPHLSVRQFVSGGAVPVHGFSDGDPGQIFKGLAHLAGHLFDGDALGGEGAETGVLCHAQARAESQGQDLVLDDDVFMTKHGRLGRTDGAGDVDDQAGGAGAEVLVTPFQTAEEEVFDLEPDQAFLVHHLRDGHGAFQKIPGAWIRGELHQVFHRRAALGHGLPNCPEIPDRRDRDRTTLFVKQSMTNV